MYLHLTETGIRKRENANITITAPGRWNPLLCSVFPCGYPELPVLQLKPTQVHLTVVFAQPPLTQM